MEENRNPIQPEDENRIYSGGEEPEKNLNELEAELKAKREKKIENFRIDISASEPSEGDIDFFPNAAARDSSAASEEELYSCSKEFRSQKEQQPVEKAAKPKKKKSCAVKKERLSEQDYLSFCRWVDRHCSFSGDYCRRVRSSGGQSHGKRRCD